MLTYIFRIDQCYIAVVFLNFAMTVVCAAVAWLLVGCNLGDVWCKKFVLEKLPLLFALNLII